MTESEARDLEARLRDVMSAIAGDLGVRVEPAKVTWTRDGRFTATISGEVIGAAPEEAAADGEAEEWATWVRRKAQRSRGLRSDHLGATLELNLRRYVITGISHRSAERPVVTRDEDGNRQRLSVADVVRGLGLPKPRLPDPRAMCLCGYSAKFHRGLLGPVVTDGSEAPLKSGDRVLLAEDRRGGLREERGAFESLSGDVAVLTVDKVYRAERDDGSREVEVARVSKLLCERFRPSGKLGGEG